MLPPIFFLNTMTLSINEIANLTQTAIHAARLGGAILQDYAKKGFTIHSKGQAINLVTEADLRSEEAIIQSIRNTFPEHQILSEEQGLQDIPQHPIKWIIDPLDGTINFAHGFPMYNVSIGVEYQGTCVIGVIYDPTRDELFLGQQGRGATLNGTPIHVSATPKLAEALLVTGFAYDIHTATDNNLKEFCAFTLRARGMRRTGTAAIDLCYIASGRLDGFWELQLNPWDTAAGKVIVEEAGGTVTNYAEEPYSIYDKTILATNGLIHQEMAEVLRLRESKSPS
jgi:myo-inositol-1(or 4)-monophosphatase